MDEDEIFQRLVNYLQMIQGIRKDDGYVIRRVANIGQSCAELLKQLKTEDLQLSAAIAGAAAELGQVTKIQQKYYQDNLYKQWVRKERPSGNVQIFMEAIHCVEGSLEVLLHKAGWYR